MEVHRAILQKNRNSFNCELKNYAEKHDKSDVNTELALIKLVQDGVVDPQDAFFKAVDKGSFLAAAKSKGINIAA